ncbi:MAG: GNAT family N-acetyltransferase, partial [Verrucomicrobiota bacterium]
MSRLASSKRSRHLEDSMLTIRTAKEADFPSVARLIYSSTNAWYVGKGLGPIFAGEPEDCLIFPEVYEDLDPGDCLLAIRDDFPEVAGSCFVHERETHVSLGIMNCHPSQVGRGIAKALLTEVVERAKKVGKPLRLVSSAINLDSYSLYTRQGFVPFGLFQDMILPVPEGGFRVPVPAKIRLREGRTGDAAAIDSLEQEIWKTSRERDWHYFLENRRGVWQVTVAEHEDGSLVGALCSVAEAGCTMLGPGLAKDGPVGLALLLEGLNRRADLQPVFLVPAGEGWLVSELYQRGARN